MNMDGPEMLAGSLCPNSWCHVIANWISFSSGCQYHTFILPTGVDWHRPVWTAHVGPHEAFGVCRIESADAGSLGVSRCILKRSLAFIAAPHEHGWTRFATPDFMTYLERFSATHCILFAFGLICSCLSLEKEDVSPFSVHLNGAFIPKEREGAIAKANLLPGKSSRSDQMNCHSFALPGWQSGILLQELEFQPAVRNMDQWLMGCFCLWSWTVWFVP